MGTIHACSVAAALVTILVGQGELYTYHGSSTSVGLGDVDADGVPDFLVGDASAGAVFSGRDGTLLRSFAPLPQYETILPSSALGDVDGDGSADIPYGRANDVTVYSGATGAVLFRDVAPPQHGTVSVAGLGDVDGDGRPDLLNTYATLNGSYQFVQRIVSGASGSTIRQWATNPIHIGSVYGRDLADVDGDGRGDYVETIEPIYPNAPTYLIYSGRTHTVLRSFLGGARKRIEPVRDDLDGDGSDEYLVAETPGRGRTPFVQLCSGATGQVLAQWTNRSSATAAGDVDGDGTADLALGGWNGSSYDVEILSGRTRMGLQTLRAAQRVEVLGDVDGDGRGDLLVMSYNSPVVRVWSARAPDFTGVPSAATLGGAIDQSLTLSAPARHANRVYWILGSLSGTAPGVAVGAATVPLNADAYTVVTATVPGGGLISGPVGLLSPGATASARLTMPALPAVAGLTLHHAYVVLGATGIMHTSRAVPLALLR